jgi:hypothetical protein
VNHSSKVNTNFVISFKYYDPLIAFRKCPFPVKDGRGMYDGQLLSLQAIVSQQQRKHAAAIKQMARREGGDLPLRRGKML